MSKLSNLPPMKSLISAEAVVRNKSVSKAAEELNITPSAISQQLRVLEGAIKIPIFSRVRGKVSVKPEYINYFKEITRSLDIMKSAGESLRLSDKFSTLTVSIVPSFASLCLINYLSVFLKKYPTIKLNMISSLNIVDFGTDSVDVSIRYTATTSDSSLVFEKIRDDYLLPCATKSMVQDIGSENIERIIKNNYLLEDISTPLWNVKPNWISWYPESWFNKNKILAFTDYNHVINAGKKDIGAFIARTGLMIDPKLDDTLVPLADNYLKSGASFYIVYSSHIPLKPHTRAFKNWILHQFSK
jgi:LysR family glycine cleavage system transcriptional activator